MPIGLPEIPDDVRPDALARKVLKGRASCVFNTPCRQAVYADTYDKANELNHKALNKGLSQQSFAIAPKIREIDQLFLRIPEYKIKLRESHPEICFAMMNSGIPLVESKHTIEGQKTRIKLLSRYYDRTWEFIASVSAAPEFNRMLEDCIDALCLAVTGMLGKKNGFRSLPDTPQEDSRGILMQIIYANVGDGHENSSGIKIKKSIQYNKLIRDKIPDIISQNGKKAFVSTLDDKWYKMHLDSKLQEELQEYLSSDNPEELADLVEVIYAIVKYKGLTIEAFEGLRKRKGSRERRFR
jgi:predicted RNase H-like nuclease/predicted house-cleaning noncanonical NTP pyrophosphatase (MazG superfamily)